MAIEQINDITSSDSKQKWRITGEDLEKIRTVRQRQLEEKSQLEARAREIEKEVDQLNERSKALHTELWDIIESTLGVKEDDLSLTIDFDQGDLGVYYVEEEERRKGGLPEGLKDAVLKTLAA